MLLCKYFKTTSISSTLFVARACRQKQASELTIPDEIVIYWTCSSPFHLLVPFFQHVT